MFGLLQTAVAAGMAFAGLASACAAGETGTTCVTSGGSWLYIIQPAEGSSYAAGGPLYLQWDLCPGSNGIDTAFSESDIYFELLDDSNPSNAPAISGGNITFTQAVHPSDGQATGTIPASVPAGTNYGIRSDYHEASDDKWIYCFGNKFTITAATNGGNTATVATAAAAVTSATKTGGAAKTKFAAIIVAVAAALFTL